jgi:FdhD protein
MPFDSTKTTRYAPGAVPYTCWSIKLGQAEAVQGGLSEEISLSLYLNGQELSTVMCSPIDQEALALGFLYTEGVIRSRDEVRLIRLNAARTLIDIFLDSQPVNLPRRMVLTSGCGGGISLRDLAETYPPLTSDLAITPEVIGARMRDLNDSARLYHQVRGVHTSILGNAEKLLISAEDIGRHNTIDKLAGKALQAGIDTCDSILVTSGRISSEMLGKARQMGVPLVASRTAPTSIAVNLAKAWNICVVGYVRRNGMRVYTHPHRLGLPDVPEWAGNTDGRRNETLTIN